MNLIWDIVSVSIVAYVIYPFLRYADSSDPRWIWMGSGILLADTTTKLIKMMTHKLGATFERPREALNCDVFCRNGNVAGRPGFPSGHMTITTFFFVYMWLKYKSTKLALFGTFAVVLMAFARIQKSCHNEIQVLAGTAWGALLAVFWFKLENKIPFLITK